MTFAWDAPKGRGGSYPFGMSVKTSLAGEPWTSLSGILDLIRTGEATSRPEIERATGLGRSIVTERVAFLLDNGVVVEDVLGPSTGGRRARMLRIQENAGFVLVVAYGVNTVGVGIANANAQIVHWNGDVSDVADGPEAILTSLEARFDRLLESPEAVGDFWGIGVGLPGPVEFATGKPVSPPMMPGWDGYDARKRLELRYGVPVQIDNDVNLMALGEMRTGVAKGVEDFIFLKVGTGIGAGFVSSGRLHRGARGLAGDVGHTSVDKASTLVCRCGRLGCLETVAGGYGLMRDARDAAASGRSTQLAAVADATGSIALADIMDVADHGDPVVVDLLVKSGDVVGRLLGNFVSLFNPAMIVIGGTMSTGDVLLSSIRRSVYEWSQPLATKDLRIVQSPNQSDVAMRGAVHLVLDFLFTPQHLAVWWGKGVKDGLAARE